MALSRESISQNPERLGPNFALHSGTTQDRDHQDFCKIEGSRCGTKISVHLLDPNAAVAASNQSKTYTCTCRSHIFHVGPNNTFFFKN